MTPAVVDASGPARSRGLNCVLINLACALAAGAFPLSAAEPPADSSAAILQELRTFREMATVLHVAAHPDDENTQLITYLARGRGYRAAYLSITRGDGGQNLLGPQFDEQLGVARTQELLAARRLDGGRQFFTRAIDFGYSKTPAETLKIWNRQEVLSDVVRVIRTFRPDVIITRFSPQGGGHGHHTSSAILSVEAFKLAGDPTAFPDQLSYLKPWQPKRILLNAGGGRGGGGGNTPGALRVEMGGNDPVLGEGFGSISGRSRAMHKTQGFGNFGGGGGPGGAQSFVLLDGEPATNDIMDGIDTTWNRVAGGAEVGKLADEAIAKFNSNDLAANVSALLAIRSRVVALPADPIVAEKRQQLDHIIQSCLGLSVETVVSRAEVVPGEPLKMQHTATMQASSVPVRWVAVRYPSIKQDVAKPMELRAKEPAVRDSTQTLPVNTPLSQPYWLREDASTGLFRVDDPKLIGQPENPPAFPVEQVFEINGQVIVIPDEPVQIAGPTKEKPPGTLKFKFFQVDQGEQTVEVKNPAAEASAPTPDAWKRRRLEVIPPVSLEFASEVKLFAPGAENSVEVELTAFRAGTSGTLQLDAPSGWKISAAQPFQLKNVGDQAKLKFTVTAPKEATVVRVTARAKVGNATFSNQRVEIRYDHIPPQLLQPPARARFVVLDMAIRGKKVGYLPGAGDNVAECLKEMGYQVTLLTGADLKTNWLKEFDGVVVGIRALNTRTDLEQWPALFDYVEGGGTVVVQYNRTGGRMNNIAPYPLTVSGDRVTDEQAEITFLAPDHPALNTPNKITKADFDGWVQERGIYFPNQWGKEFTPILACNDAGEQPKAGGLLVARHGKGYFVYTGLVFFRELPDGVPGAFRLFANLVSLGK